MTIKILRIYFQLVMTKKPKIQRYQTNLSIFIIKVKKLIMISKYCLYSSYLAKAKKLLILNSEIKT